MPNRQKDEPGIEDFVFKDLHIKKQKKGAASTQWQQIEIRDDQIHNENSQRRERVIAEKNSFSIMPEVFESRGLAGQKQKEQSRELKKIIEEGLSEKEKSAYDKGFEQGQKDGQRLALEAAQKQLEETVTKTRGDFSQLLSHKAELFEQSEEEMVKLVSSLTKWVLLREFDGKDYLSRLLKKLIHEIREKDHLILRVHPRFLAEVREILPNIEEHFGELKNFRIEEDRELSSPGLALESKNMILSAGLDDIFKAIDQVFASGRDQ